MEKVILLKEELFVPKEVKELIELDLQDFPMLGELRWKVMLNSESYKNGRISIELLNWLIKEARRNKYNIVKALISDNYANGKVSEEDLKLLSYDKTKDAKLLFYQIDSLIEVIKSENYGKGFISHETLKLMFETKKLQKNKFPEIEYNAYGMPIILKELLCSESYAAGFVSDGPPQLLLDDKIRLLLKANTVEQAYSLYCILTSENYANGLISNYEINKIIENPNSGQILPYTMILTSYMYRDKLVDEEELEKLLDKRFFVIAKLISYLINTPEITNEDERDNYILTILNLENKEELCNLCKSYIEKGIVKTEDKFVENFAWYNLIPSRLELQSSSYTKKRANN